MEHDSDCVAVTPRQARGRVRRAKEVMVSTMASGRVLLVRVSKRAALQALTRSGLGDSVSVQDVFGALILGE